MSSKCLSSSAAVAPGRSFIGTPSSTNIRIFRGCVPKGSVSLMPSRTFKKRWRLRSVEKITIVFSWHTGLCRESAELNRGNAPRRGSIYGLSGPVHFEGRYLIAGCRWWLYSGNPSDVTSSSAELDFLHDPSGCQVADETNNRHYNSAGVWRPAVRIRNLKSRQFLIACSCEHPRANNP